MKFAGIVNSPFNKPEAYEQFQYLYYHASSGLDFNGEQWIAYANLSNELAMDVVRAANITISTTVQRELPGFIKNQEYDDVMTDESSVLTDASLLCAWRRMENLHMVGGVAQLSAIMRSTKQDDPMRKFLEFTEPVAALDPAQLPVLLTDRADAYEERADEHIQCPFLRART